MSVIYTFFVKLKSKGNCKNLFSFGDSNIPSIRTESGHIKQSHHQNGTWTARPCTQQRNWIKPVVPSAEEFLPRKEFNEFRGGIHPYKN